MREELIGFDYQSGVCNYFKGDQDCMNTFTLNCDGQNEQL